jgi:hypothetical protein
VWVRLVARSEGGVAASAATPVSRLLGYRVFVCDLRGHIRQYYAAAKLADY